MKLQLKISMGEICLMIPKSGAKFEEKLIFYFKNDKNLVNFDLSTKSLKNLHFDWSLLNKVYNVSPKKVQRSCILWHWRIMQIWRKTDLCFGKWHEEFSKFSLEHLKVSKLVFSWDPFVQSRKCMSYKLTEEL